MAAKRGLAVPVIHQYFAFVVQLPDFRNLELCRAVSHHRKRHVVVENLRPNTCLISTLTFYLGLTQSAMGLVCGEVLRSIPSSVLFAKV